jgi:hypothetical protein
MFGLVSKLIDILSPYMLRFLDGRRGSADAAVAARLFELVLILQELVARGERILVLAEGLLAGAAQADDGAEFEDLLASQLQGLEELQAVLEESRELLATIDVNMYLDLVPFIDRKSGLLTRWGQQATRGQFSTTTLFFLQSSDLRRVIDAGRSATSPDGMVIDRTEYLVEVINAIKRVRSHEVRDIRGHQQKIELAISAQIAGARSDLANARTACIKLVAATEEAIGAEAIASLRRRILKDGMTSRARTPSLPPHRNQRQ